MRSCSALIVLVGLAGCSAPCSIDPQDAGCFTAADCADAGDFVPCAEAGKTCRLCVPSYHSYNASCERTRDGGLEWVVSRGIPPAACVP